MLAYATREILKMLRLDGDSTTRLLGIDEMFKALGNLKSMFEQAQQMGGKVEELKAQLRQQKIEGSSGGGMVTVVVNGLGEMLQ